MKVKIYPSSPKGEVTVPPSKSMAHRLLLCAGLSKGKSVIENVAFSEDILATLDCLSALGVKTEISGNAVTVYGTGGVFRTDPTLPCRESGSTLRFFLPLCLLAGGGTLTGNKRLLERPLSVYEDLGVCLTKTAEAVTCRGPLQAGDFFLPGNVSSQFITGLLFALPLLSGDSKIICTTPLESASYLRLTLSALEQFGITVHRESERVFVVPGNQTYRPQTATVEGDESNAAFLGALSLFGEVSLQGRNPETLQGDRVWEDAFARLREGFCEFSLRDCPDLAPILMTVAALHHGCRLTDTRRLKIKESDRGTAMAEELAKFGANVRVDENCIEILKSPLHPPKTPLCGHNDHRVVMALAVMGLGYGGTIQGAEAVGKSYPDFFDVLKQANVRLEEL